jgi:cbb3-type cytochrome oxidase maturation protein
MEWLFYTVAFLIAVAITASAVYALHWAVKSGQFRDLEKGATTIFDDEEPMGTPTDFTLGKPPARRSAARPPAPKQP